MTCELYKNSLPPGRAWRSLEHAYLRTDLSEIMKKKVSVRESGKQRRIPRQEAMLQRTICVRKIKTVHELIESTRGIGMSPRV